jgi:hypothetical protein
MIQALGTKSLDAVNISRMNDLQNALRPRWMAVLLLAWSMAGCLSGGGRRSAVTERQALAVHEAVIDSLYRRGARGRKIGVVVTTLDTTCVARTCLPLRARWGLDSLSLSGGRESAADEMRQDLLTRIAAGSRTPVNRLDASTHVLIDASAVPPASADAAAWRAFHDARGTAAVVSFSPIGFSDDRRNALVVVRMDCGVRCGHQVRVMLGEDPQGRWRIHDLLRLDTP